MSAEFVVFCIADVSSPPVALIRRKNTGAFYSHIPVPLPPQLVIFAEGKWDDNAGDLEVTLSYKDDQIHLGYVTHLNRCICWKRDAAGELPASMTSETEKGVAKLLLEHSEGPPVLESMVESVRVLEETQNTPDRQKKNKRRSSLNKDEKKSTGPSLKKQKVQGDKLGPRQQKGGKDFKTDGEKKEEKGTPKARKPSKSENISEIITDCNKAKSNNVDVSVSSVSDTDRSDNKDNISNNLTKVKVKQNRKSLDNEPSPSATYSGKKRGRKSSAAKSAEGADKTENITQDTTKCIDSVIETVTRPESQDNVLQRLDVTTACKKNDVSHKKSKDGGSEVSGKKRAQCKDLTSRAYDRPTKRWGHSLCFVNKNLSVLIGGQGEKQQLNKDSVWGLDAETRRWRSLTTQSEGQKPEYRMGHTATFDPMVRCIYVFGGSKNTRWFHDVHILDTDEWKWQLVKVSGKAPTRAYHSATLYRHELWIFGGVYPRPDPQPDGCSNDIHIFSPVMESWYDPIVKGTKPIPRSGHSATLVGDQLVIFGGWDAPISYQDLHVLDMSIVEWTQPKVNGTPPSPRSWHASCALSNSRLLINGGYNGDIALDDTFIFNLDSLTWAKIELENSPAARVGHKAVCMPYRHDNDEEDEVLIFGGGDNDGAYFEDLLGLYIPFEVEICG